MENIFEEGEIKGAIESVTKLQTKTILNQMENSVCKIIGNKNGSGFFCNIEKNKEKIPVLMTNYHIIDDNFLKNEKILKIFFRDKSIPIKRDKIKKVYSCSNYDIMILRIYEEDEFRNINYLEIDDSLSSRNPELAYEDSSIYILHYPMSKEINVSYGYGIKEKNKNNIIHKCMTSYGSSGAPILNLSTNKVIGIHKSFIKSINKENKEDCYNLGTLLKYPLIDMSKKSDGLKLSTKKKLATIENKNKNKNLSSQNIILPAPKIENKIDLKKEILQTNKRMLNQRLSYCINNNNYTNDYLKIDIVSDTSKYDNSAIKNKKIYNNINKDLDSISINKLDLTTKNKRTKVKINHRDSFINFNKLDLTTRNENRIIEINKHSLINIKNNAINKLETINHENIQNLNINNKIKKKSSLISLKKYNITPNNFSKSQSYFYKPQLNKFKYKIQKAIEYNKKNKKGSLLIPKVSMKIIHKKKLSLDTIQLNNNLKDNKSQNKILQIYNYLTYRNYDISKKTIKNNLLNMTANNFFQKGKKLY